MSSRAVAHRGHLIIVAVLAMLAAFAMGRRATALPVPDGQSGGSGGTKAEVEAPADNGEADSEGWALTDEEVLDRLENMRISVSFRNADLDQVVEQLSEQLRINITVDWKWLAGWDVRRDDRITLTLRQAKPSSVLETLIRQMSPKKLHERDIDYHVMDGMIAISHDWTARHHSYLKAYDVSDLFESGYGDRRFANTPVLALETTGREFIGGEKTLEDRLQEEKEQMRQRTRGGGGGIFGDPSDDPDRLSQMERIQHIVDLITMHVDPEGWLMTGGDVGTLHVHNQTLLIEQTARNHAEIERFLDILRSTRPAPVDVDIIVIELRNDYAAELRQRYPSFPRVPAEFVDGLLRAERSEEIVLRATTSSRVGERAWFSAVTQREIIDTLGPTVSEQRALLQPVKADVTSGLELIVLPLRVPGTEELSLDVQLAWIPEPEVESKAVAVPGQSNDARVEAAERKMRTVSTNTRAHMGDGLVLTIPNELTSSLDAPDRETLLVVRVREADEGEAEPAVRISGDEDDEDQDGE